MIAKRIIPIFLLKGKRLVKGTNFTDFQDVGDPISQGMIYDAQGADEIMIMDIEASLKGRAIGREVINSMITKCRLPIGAGGGIKDIACAHECFKAGADKVIVNTHAVLNPLLVKELSCEFGSQSVVVCIDVKRSPSGKYEVYTHSGTRRASVTLDDHLEQVAESGAGEIILTSIDREGTLSGFEYGLYEKLKGRIKIPFIASGGAGKYDDLVELFSGTDCDACAIGKMLFLRDYDIVRIKAYLKGKNILIRDA